METTIEPAFLIDSLRRTSPVLESLLKGLPEADAHWKPSEKEWSIVEVMAHLGDEEAEDFRARLESVLTDPARPLKPIDPEGWAVERCYNDRSLPTEIERFARERAKSLGWLAAQKSLDWSLGHTRPKGMLRAGDLLASWAAHDLLHLRQIAKRLHQLAGRHAGPFETGYAGLLT